jgi:hypothetical protein
LLAWLTASRCMARCCLRPRRVGLALVISVPAAWPAPDQMGSARSQNYEFSELRVRFRATPFTSPHSLISPVACATQPYPTGRLTRPYPGRLAILADRSCSTGTHCQVTLIFLSSFLPYALCFLCASAVKFRLSMQLILIPGSLGPVISAGADSPADRAAGSHSNCRVGRSAWSV